MKPDDSSLDPNDLRSVEARAKSILDRAEAWERFPIPIDDLLSAAKVRLALTSAFHPASIISYLKSRASHSSNHIKSAIGKVLGLYDAAEATIHISSDVNKSKQTFLKLHETGHHEMPVHRKMYRFFQECRGTLDPTIADQFEREANNFARYVLFKGDSFARHAADSKLNIKTPIELSRKFGASIYASAREFARTHTKACLVIVLDPVEGNQGTDQKSRIRRIEVSSTFLATFGNPKFKTITPAHKLWSVIPFGRKMTKPTSLTIKDLNGQVHECLAEGFDTTYNIIILLYPIRELRNNVILSNA